MGEAIVDRHQHDGGDQAQDQLAPLDEPVLNSGSMTIHASKITAHSNIAGSCGRYVK
jgi:hypothetical protein